MTEKEIKDFMRFLKDNGIYSAFIRNYKDKHNDKNKTLEKYLEYIPCDNALSCAFRYHATKEGFDFWSNKRDEWVKLALKNYSRGNYKLASYD